MSCEPVPAALRGIAAPVGTLGFTLAVVMPSIPEEGLAELWSWWDTQGL